MSYDERKKNNKTIHINIRQQTTHPVKNKIKKENFEVIYFLFILTFL